MGLDHPLIVAAIDRWKALAPEDCGTAVCGNGDAAVLTWWLVETRGKGGESRRTVQPIAVTPDGQRVPAIEASARAHFRHEPGQPFLDPAARADLLATHIEPMLQREVRHRNAAVADGGFTSELIAWLECA
jgi:hypothetical protein